MKSKIATIHSKKASTSRKMVKKVTMKSHAVKRPAKTGKMSSYK